MKIGIYGGTFNPIHNAHVHILNEFCRELNLDKILVIPTKEPPHKIAHALATGEDRINMIKLALCDFPFEYEISDMEMKRAEKSFTVDTLKELRKTYPDDEFYLMMGEDMFLTIQSWFKSEIIMKEAVICGAPRSESGMKSLEEHAENLKKEYPYFKYLIKNIAFLDISSTEIRESINDREKLVSLVPERVADYIQQNNLYK
ncbi:MAG: nicotinate-nucleotide adenylyltransferase [Clostridia bacterium]|nr:nicotinate-nucleotide adenylyltransferase [Clostridia bacterium]